MADTQDLKRRGPRMRGFLQTVREAGGNGHVRVRDRAGAEAEEAEGSEETLMESAALVNDATAIERAVLALVLVRRALHSAGAHGEGYPAVKTPARLFNLWRVFGAGDFAAKRPIETGRGGWLHGRLLVLMRSAPLSR
jgi:hypothetical protein